MFLFRSADLGWNPHNPKLDETIEQLHRQVSGYEGSTLGQPSETETFGPDSSYKYLTTDQMDSLADDSIQPDVTNDEKHQKAVIGTKNEVKVQAGALKTTIDHAYYFPKTKW
jgi:hypothetical protein